MMDPDLLVEAELNRIDWNIIRVATGPASLVPEAIRELLNAKSADEVDRAYWKLENHIVVQGQLYEAAQFVVPVIMAALTKPDRPRFVRVGLLELLFQIVRGRTHEDELSRGLDKLEDHCKAAAKEGLWVLYREYLEGIQSAAKELIQCIDDENTRINHFDHALSVLG